MSEPKTTVRHRYCGLRDVYVAKVTQNDGEGYTAETPVKMARAIKAKISDKFTSEKLYSDDGVEGMLQAYEGTDVELEVNTLAAADRAAFFGQAYLNGFLLKSAEDEAPEVALGYRVRRLNGKFDFVWMYCGRFAQGNEDNYETEAAKRAQRHPAKAGQRETDHGKRPAKHAEQHAAASGRDPASLSKLQPCNGQNALYCNWVNVRGIDGNGYWVLAGFFDYKGT